MLAVPRRYQHTQNVPLFGHSLLTNKTLVSVKGPDAAKFLNGLVTYKMLPTYIKKNEMTISTATIDKSLSLQSFDLQSNNWGSLRESIETGNQTINRNGIFTSILNSKGRVISDLFIYPYQYCPDTIINKESHYLVEVHTELAKTLLGIFRLHKLKAKVNFSIMENLKVWYAYNDQKQDATYNQQMIYFNEESQHLKNPTIALENSHKFLDDPTIFQHDLDKNNVLGFAFDERCPDFGIKIITPSTVERISDVLNTEYLPESEPLPLATLNTRRYMAGIAEAPTELTPNKYLPLESCLEYMGGINFDKGCYIGQELTVRTHHTGIVRKRIVPIKLYPFDKDSDDVKLDFENQLEISSIDNYGNLDIYSDTPEIDNKKKLASSPFGDSGKVSSRRSSRRTSSGVLLGINGSIGLALVRLEDFATDRKFFLELPSSNESTIKVGVKAFIPYWWPAE